MNPGVGDWWDWTWNPVTGCYGPGGTAEKLHRCPYCYAHRTAKWLAGRCGYPAGDACFNPTFHPGRLGEPQGVKKPSRIFVCSMGDLFADTIPLSWIGRVLSVAESERRHTYIFLTQNPVRYMVGEPWPSNCWLGTTVVHPADLTPRLEALSKVKAQMRFLSLEPLLYPALVKNGLLQNAPLAVEWVILGGLSGRIWYRNAENIEDLVGVLKTLRIPVFCKRNLGIPGLPREFPKTS